MKNIILTLILFSIAASVTAQQMSLEDFNLRFNQELDKITAQRDKQISDLKLKYLGALLRLETQAKSRGNLELVEATRAEIARIERGEPQSPFTDQISPELKEMQQVMQDLGNKYRSEAAQSIVKLVDSLKEYATGRSVESTRQNDIPQAVAWRDWCDNLSENDTVSAAYAMTGSAEADGEIPNENQGDSHEVLKGQPAKIIKTLTVEFSDRPKVYTAGSEPKGNEKRIRSSTPSMQGSGHTQLTGTLILIEEKDINKSGYSGNYKEKSLTYVPRLSISPLMGKNLDRCLVVFDLYKRGTGSKRSIIRTDEILIPALNASDRVVVDAGKYEYETEEYDSSWSTYDYKNTTADEFYGFIVTIFNKDGELIFQRTTERILNDYARETPP